VSETDKEVKVTAEVSGLDEKDLAVELTDGVLTISGEKRARPRTRIACSASGIMAGSSDGSRSTTSSRTRSRTVTLPKTAKAQQNVKRIAINGK